MHINDCEKPIEYFSKIDPAAKAADYNKFFSVWNPDLFDGLMYIDCTWCAR